jgi:hypothetical protein
VKHVEEALRALCESEERVEGSAELEARVRSAFLAQRRRRAMRRRLAWSLAAAAAVAIAILMITVRRPPAPAISKVVRESPAPVVQDAFPAVAPVVVAAKPVRRAVERPREMVTDFFPLIDAPPPMERGEMVRMTVPVATMRAVGLPVSEERLNDRVQADVLVSEDGLATAIRFVKNE